MLAALKWSKWLGVAALLITIGALWLTLDASRSSQFVLNEKLKRANEHNAANIIAIETLTDSAERANQLLVTRRQQQLKEQGKLDDDIAELKRQLENVECHIPSSVTDRLREPY
jgi:hypothetical protein